MSEAIRTAISTAVETVDGLNCTPYFRQSTKAGDAWVQMKTMNRDSSGFGFMVTWQVQILLPQDLATAEKYIETKLSALIDAVSEELIITSITPVNLILPDTQLPCLLIEGNRASD